MGIGPERRHRRALELAYVHVERGTAQVTALQRVGERFLVNDLSTRNVDQNATCLHGCKALLVKQTRCLPRPLAADHHGIALWQEAIEGFGTAELAKSRRQRRIAIFT